MVQNSLSYVLLIFGFNLVIWNCHGVFPVGCSVGSFVLVQSIRKRIFWFPGQSFQYLYVSIFPNRENLVSILFAPILSWLHLFAVNY